MSTFCVHVRFSWRQVIKYLIFLFGYFSLASVQNLSYVLKLNARKTSIEEVQLFQENLSIKVHVISSNPDYHMHCNLIKTTKCEDQVAWQFDHPFTLHL